MSKPRTRTLAQIAAMARRHPFWKHVDLSGGSHACWPWTGAKDRDGYGHQGGRRANRTAYELHRCMNLAPGEVIRHKCDNPPCCNPMHLESGGQLDNVRDRVKRGRSARGVFNGRAVLTTDKVMQVYAAGGTYAAIAAQFGVRKAAVADIKTGRNWGWLTGADSHMAIKRSRAAEKQRAHLAQVIDLWGG